MLRYFPVLRPTLRPLKLFSMRALLHSAAFVGTFSQPIIHNRRLAHALFARMQDHGILRHSLTCPPYLDVVTCHDYSTPSLLEQCLLHVGIESYTVLRGPRPWKDINKLLWLHQHLLSICCDDRYLLFCDANDVLVIDDLERTIEILEDAQCDALFMSTRFQGGLACMPDVWTWTDAIDNGRYLNAGVFIGRHKFLLEILSASLAYITSNSITPAEYKALGRGMPGDSRLCTRLKEFPKGGTDQDILRFMYPCFYPRMRVDKDQKLAFREYWWQF